MLYLFLTKTFLTDGASSTEKLPSTVNPNLFSTMYFEYFPRLAEVERPSCAATQFLGEIYYH